MEKCPKLFLVLLFFCTIASLSLTTVSSSAVSRGGHKESRATGTVEQEQGIPHEVHCSRERSRAAWKIIQEYLMPFVDKEQYKISSRRRLHPDNDMYRDQEEHKNHLDYNEWQCGYCKKTFYEEKFLDKHFDSRHFDSSNTSHGRCLADVCGALHCDLMMDSIPRNTKCNPAAAVKNKHLCEVLVLHSFPLSLSHQSDDSVQSLADSCFPAKEGPSALRLHEFFLRQFCDSHTCLGGHKPFPKGGKKQTNALYIISSVLLLMVLLLFYIFIYLYQRGIKVGAQGLKRLPKGAQKKKPS